MSEITKEQFEAEKQKTKNAMGTIQELQKELSTTKKIANSAAKLQEQNNTLIAEVDKFRKDNKELEKSGAVIRSDKMVVEPKPGVIFDAGGFRHIATVNHGKEDRDELYRYNLTKGADKVVDYLVQYRGGKLAGSQIS